MAPLCLPTAPWTRCGCLQPRRGRDEDDGRRQQHESRDDSIAKPARTRWPHERPAAYSDGDEQQGINGRYKDSICPWWRKKEREGRQKKPKHDACCVEERSPYMHHRETWSMQELDRCVADV